MSYTSSCLRSLRLASSWHSRVVWPTTRSQRHISTTTSVRTEPAVPVSDRNASAGRDVPGEKQAEVDASAVKATKHNEDTVPFLQRPLGVRERPTTVPKTWREEMMDDETRKDHREKLLKEATKGYFSDLNATRKFGGKTWVAPRVLIREDKALYFPDISGTPLNANNKVHTTDLLLGKVSVIRMLSSKISELQTEMFCEPTHAAFKENPLYQLVQINLQENLIKSLLVSLFSRSIRKTISSEQWGTYLISNQNMDYVRDNLGMTNRHLGYVYLVDSACRIRWAGCADPIPAETEALKVCTDVLLKRHKK